MLFILRPLIPLLVAIGLVLLSLLQQALAQTTDATRLPSAADIEAVRRSLPDPADLERATRDLKFVAPRIPESAPGTPGGPSLNDLVERYQRQQRGEAQDEQERSVDGVMLFVSLGMPAESLRRAIADVQRLRAKLVLRGVQNGSLRSTTLRIKELVGDAKVAWSIDPALFRRFDIHAVPATVLVDPARPVLVACGASQCQEPSYRKVAGDVSLAHALGAIAQADPEFAPLALRYAARLGARP